jgi:hypothetical protein
VLPTLESRPGTHAPNVDAIIANEYEELRAGGRHADALRAAVKTDLPFSDLARRLNRARAR